MCSFGCQIENGPPVGSTATAIRPELNTSIGSDTTEPPESTIRATVASASSTEMYVLQYGPEPSWYIGEIAPTSIPWMRSIV